MSALSRLNLVEGARLLQSKIILGFRLGRIRDALHCGRRGSRGAGAVAQTGHRIVGLLRIRIIRLRIRALARSIRSCHLLDSCSARCSSMVGIGTWPGPSSRTRPGR
jgi:hypothetical protein